MDNPENGKGKKGEKRYFRCFLPDRTQSVLN
jgi:hypothetical protein